MIRISEWVSNGHPDKVADIISSHILDEYLKRDPKVRYALEVMIKNNDVYLGGEISSHIIMEQKDYEHFVKDALDYIGYTVDYSNRWGDDAIDIRKVKVTANISKQSSDISKGVDRNGWGDQGIFVGYAENTYLYLKSSTNEFVNECVKMFPYMPIDHSIAKVIGDNLYTNSIIYNEYGIDIKTQVSFNEENNNIDEIVVAIPCQTSKEEERIKNWIEERIKDNNSRILLNQAGRYTTHSSVGDCGMTGRKLVVDFYGSASKIGGGSPWTKDYTKADLALNLYARYLAVQAMKQNEDDNVHHIEVLIGSTIGQPVEGYFLNKYSKTGLISTTYMKEFITPSSVNELLELDKPDYTIRCSKGLFYDIY